MTVEFNQDNVMPIDEVQREKELLKGQDFLDCGILCSSQCAPCQNLTEALSPIEETANNDEISEFKSMRNSLVQRTSARVSKRIKKEMADGSCLSEPQQSSKKGANKRDSQPGQFRTRRSWELWSVEDKNNFFDALCEYGKDFENIQSYIAQRSRKKGILPNMIKNKDQVRHFYYRTWHKISKYLDIGDEVKKQTQELYGLINYAELRKKIGGCWNVKNRQKLNELVFHGVTTVKFRGKKLRIKTPICRALKKLNFVEETKEPECPKLPKEIYIEFRPKTNAAWVHVQNLSQNPRLRTKVFLQRRLSTIISYLEKRWKHLGLQQSQQIASNLLHSFSKQRVQPENVPVLRLRPHCTSNVSLLSVSSTNNASFASVCLEKHVKKFQVDHKEKEHCKNKKIVRTKCKPKVTVSDCDEHLEAAEKLSFDNDTSNPLQNVDICPNIFKLEQQQQHILNTKNLLNLVDSPEEDLEQSLSLFKNILESTHTTNGCDKQRNETLLEDQKSLSEEEEHLNAERSDVSDDKNFAEEKLLNIEAVKENTASSYMKSLNEEKQRILKGWNLQDVGNLTVGELFLMLKCPEKLVLEYEFEYPPEHYNGDDAVEKALQLNSQIQQIGLVLKKFVSVAATYFSDFKNKQTPLSPTNRGNSQNRLVTTPPSKTYVGRGLGRSPVAKPTACSHLECSCTESSAEAQILSESSGNFVEDGDTTISSQSESQATTTGKENDRHVFVVPVRAAPRNVKASNIQDSGSEGFELISGHRNQRRKRKPFVVKRALLPRSNDSQPMGAMTLVQLLPSNSPLTAVLPSNTCNSVQKMMVPSAKKVVEVLPTVSSGSMNVQPLQIPLLKPVTSGSSNMLPPCTTPTTHVVKSTADPVNPVQTLNAGLLSLEEKGKSVITITSNMIASSTVQLPSTSVLTSSPNKSPALATICITTSSISSPPQMSIPERTSTGLSPPNISSLLEMSLPGANFGLTDTKEQILNTSKCLSVDPMVAQRQSTPPQSPGSRFKVNSPDAQWLNGESADFSLNTLLNTFESPCKSSVHSAGDASSLDSISRLAPDVDTHLQCLINESSVDYVAKFADLAAQIASTSAESKCS